jgi:hypothetical protein
LVLKHGQQWRMRFWKLFCIIGCHGVSSDYEFYECLLKRWRNA